MQGVIFAAGKGTRLLPYTLAVPKPLLLIGVRHGRPLTIIEKLIGQMHRAGIRDICVVVGYRAELIRAYLGTGSRLGVRVRYVEQQVLDGNGGALLRCNKLLTQDVLTSDADNFVVDDTVFARLRRRYESSGADAAVCVRRVQNVSKFAIFKQRRGRLIDVYEKPRDASEWGHLAKTGFGIFSRRVLDIPRRNFIAPGGECTTTQMYKFLLDSGRRVAPFFLRGTYADIGTWDDYRAVLRKNL